MISSLTINKELINFSKSKKYICELDIFKNSDTINFKKGLNVIFAPNGSGKTTVINMLAHATHSREWGYSRVTRKSIQEKDWLKDITKEEKEERNLSWYRAGPFAVEPFFTVNHDGQAVAFCDPKFLVGGFGADDTLNFGYEYMSVHKEEMINIKGSTGKKNKHRMSLINSILNGEETLNEVVFDDKNILNRLDSYTAEKANYEYLTASIPLGQKTLLIDEPESALDLKEKISWFSTLEEKIKSQNLQVILITHSELALSFTNANFLTVKENYIEEIKQDLKSILKNI